MEIVTIEAEIAEVEAVDTEAVEIVTIEAEIVEVVAVDTEAVEIVTIEAEIAEAEAVDTEVVEIVTTAVETVVTIEAELSAEELVTGGIAMAGQGEVEDIIERKPIPIILLERTETIDYQRVSPQSLQYFSPRLSSLFTEYFLHSGQGGKPVFSFLTLLNLRGIGNRGQPFFGLRTFGILPPNLDKT